MAECFVFAATCGVTHMRRHSPTKLRVSKFLSAPSVRRFCDPGECRSIMSTAAVRSAVLEAVVASALTIRPWRFSASAWPMKQSLAAVFELLR
jgi:hypothetical protein